MSDTDDEIALRNEGGYFAIVPEWVLDTVSGNAVKLYALLRRYGDKTTGDSFPSRLTLAKRMGFSRAASVDPLITELVEAGALEVRQRWIDKRRTSNGYIVRATPLRQSSGGTPERTAEYARADSGGTPERRAVVRQTVEEPESLIPESNNQTSEPKKSKSKTKMPEGWAPTPEHVEFAKAEGYDLSREVDSFRAWALANDKRYVEWNMGFASWLRSPYGHHKVSGPQRSAPIAEPRFTKADFPAYYRRA